MVTIDTRFNGPDSTGNGGYVSGLIADASGLAGPVRVTLRIPPPLGIPLAWESHGHDGVRLETHGGTVVGTGEPGAFRGAAPTFPTAREVERGVAAYQGYDHHPFDRCYTCGPARAPGDGLRIFPGPVGTGRHAATWVVEPGHAGPDGIEGPVVWAAVDCAGGWAAGIGDAPMVLGRITAEVLDVPAVGDTCHVVGEATGVEGRKHHASTALYTASGTLLARSEQTWFVIDPAAFA